MYLSMVVFEECLAEYHPRMTGHSDLIKIKSVSYTHLTLPTN